MDAQGLQIEQGSVGYGANVLLTDLSFSVVPGHALILNGPNGSGKTSLLRCLLGLQRLQRGTVVNHFPTTGYVPQVRFLDRTFPVTVERALETSFVGPRYAFSRTARRRMRASVERALEYVGIAHRRRQLLRECSGGELQKALIARALVREPRLLVLDEPTNSLDADGRHDLLAILGRLKEDGTTLLMTTHEREIAEAALFDGEIRIERGRVNVSDRSGATHA